MKSILLTVLLLSFCQISVFADAPKQKLLRMATTTSTDNTGLLKSILPTFEAQTGYNVQVVAVGTGKARQGKRLLTVGTDCSVGKMFTALVLEKALKELEVDAKFKATGQTGILVAGDGISIDAVVADFISGAVEAISPSFNDHQWDIIEGQGSLFNPSFAGVSLGLLHGAQADALVLCHEVGRPHIRPLPHCQLPSISATIEANLAAARLTNPKAELAGISLNTSALNEEEAKALCADWQETYNVPVTDPVRFGIQSIASYLNANF